MGVKDVDAVIGEDSRVYVYTYQGRPFYRHRLLLVFNSLDHLFNELGITSDPEVDLTIYFKGERPLWMTPEAKDPQHVMNAKGET